MTRAFIIVLALTPAAQAQDTDKSPFEYADPKPRAYSFTERASKIDPRCQAHPKINSVLEQDGNPRETMRIPPGPVKVTIA